MTDKEKLTLISTVLSDAWDAVSDVYDGHYWKGVILALETILNFGGDKK